MDKRRLIEENRARKQERWSAKDIDKIQASIVELYALVAELKADLLLKKNK